MTEDKDKTKVQLLRELETLRKNEEKLRSMKRTEEALRKSELFLTDVIESIQDGISVLNPDLTVRRVNQVMREWYVENLPLEGKKCYECYHDRDKACDPCPTIRCLASGKTEQEIVPGLPGSPVEWIELFSYPIIDRETGKVTGVVEFVRDITKRRRAEKEMERLRNLLENIVDSMPSVMVAVDPEGRVTQWNKEAERMTGMKIERAQGKTLQDVFPQLAGYMEKVSQAIRERQPKKDEKIASQLNGETHFSDVTVYPLIANGGEGAVIRVDDVTERIRLQEMMIQSEKMLSVGGLAAGMAHEINNPLSGILQNAQVIRNRINSGLPKNKQIAEECSTSINAIEAYMDKRGVLPMINAIIESGLRAAKIVENMLSFSRKSESKFAPHDLGELLDKTVELICSDYDLKKKYDFRRIEIVREYQPNAPKVPCEGTKIQQVFLNILKNGAEAMVGWQPDDERKPEKSRFILRLLFDSDMAQVEIEDNGPGMNEATLKRVFEPFFTTKDVSIGTGLGLSVSYFIIAENHGGTMAVESTPGSGANFIIRLPLKRKEN